jgi:hypothetical protein
MSKFRDHFKEKLEDLGIQILTILSDNILLAVWAFSEYSLEHYLVPKFPATSQIEVFSLWVLRIVFAVSTIAPTIIFLYRHIGIIWLRAQAALSKERYELRLAPPLRKSND